MTAGPGFSPGGHRAGQAGWKLRRPGATPLCPHSPPQCSHWVAEQPRETPPDCCPGRDTGLSVRSLLGITGEGCSSGIYSSRIGLLIWGEGGVSFTYQPFAPAHSEPGAVLGGTQRRQHMLGQHVGKARKESQALPEDRPPLSSFCDKDFQNILCRASF